MFDASSPSLLRRYQVSRFGKSVVDDGLNNRLGSLVQCVFVNTSSSEFRNVLQGEEQDDGGFAPCLLATSETSRWICGSLERPLVPERKCWSVSEPTV